MTGSSLAWSSEDRDRIAAHAARTAAATRQLAGCYRALQGETLTKRQGVRDSQPSGPRMPGSQVLVNVEAMALVSDIEREALAAAQALDDLGRRAADRRAEGRTARTLARLGVVAAALPDAYAAGSAAAEDAAGVVWRLLEQGQRALGLGTRAFRADEPCPACGCPSLWVEPDQLRIGCGMPSCRRQWPIDVPLVLEHAAHITQN